MNNTIKLEELFQGNFIAEYSVIKNKMRQIKAFVFDWDGVFNNGEKNIHGHSSFNEADSMGINLLRFNASMMTDKNPPAAILTGENNELAFSFAKRENFSDVYFKVANKEIAFLHFCEQHDLIPGEVMFVFDDVLDFSVARLAGLRMMVKREASPLTTTYALQHRLVDYITANEGGHHALREVSELCMFLTNNHQRVFEYRMNFDQKYKDYITQRRLTETKFFTLSDNKIITA